jgi:hypothetical protein
MRIEAQPQQVLKGNPISKGKLEKSGIQEGEIGPFWPRE